MVGLAACVAQAQPGSLAPEPQDPVLGQLYAQVKQMWPQVAGGQMLAWPSSGFQWPCAVEEVKARRWIGGMAMPPELMDADQQRKYASDMRRGGVAQHKVEVRDVKVAPIAGSCTDGQLSGPVDYMIEFTRSDQVSASAPPMVATYRVRAQMVVDKGEVAMKTPRVLAQTMLSFKTVGVDGQPLQVPLSTFLNISTSYTHHEYHGVLLNSTPGMGFTTVFTQPVAPDTVEMWTYNGAQLSMSGRMRKSRQHGPQVMHIAGSPPQTMCFEDGEMIQAVTCDVR